MARVLVIDDETIVAKVMGEILRGEGYEVVTVSDGRTGLEYLSKYPKPDIVLTDLRMPDIDGRTVINMMNSNPELREIPKVVITGSIPDLSDFPSGDSYDAMLKKPFNINELIAIVKDLTFENDEAALTADFM